MLNDRRIVDALQKLLFARYGQIPKKFSVLQCLESIMTLDVVYRCTCMKKGYLLKNAYKEVLTNDSEKKLGPVLEGHIREMAEGSTPIVCIFCEEFIETDPVSYLIKKFALDFNKNNVLIVADDDKQFFECSIIRKALKVILPLGYEPVSCRIHCSNGPLEYTSINLPLRFKLLDTRTNNNSYIGVEIESECTGRLDKWFKYADYLPETIEVSVDVDDKDTFYIDITNNWLDEAVGDVRAIKRVEDFSTLTDLDVILDRTCPDDGQWHLPIQLITENKFSEIVTPEGLDDCNKDIRESIGQVLFNNSSDDLNPSVRGWWVADGPDGQLSVPYDYNPPMQFYSKIPGEFTMDQQQKMTKLFSNSSYCLGLDIWDPIEYVIEAVYENIRKTKAGKHGIILIGNSPPNYGNSNSTGKLLNISDSKTTYRREAGRDFEDILRKLKRMGIPVVYVFLYHNSMPQMEQGVSWGYEDDLEKLIIIEAAVQEVLKDFDNLKVFPQEATPEGIRTGLKKALAYINERSKESSKVSSIEVSIES